MGSYLPGFEPDYIRVEILRVPEEGWTVVVRAADDVRFLSPDNVVSRWEGITWGEVIEYLALELDGYSWQ